MNVEFKMTDKGEVAILPRKDYEALAAKAQEADEDFGTAATQKSVGGGVVGNADRLRFRLPRLFRPSRRSARHLSRRRRQANAKP